MTGCRTSVIYSYFPPHLHLYTTEAQEPTKPTGWTSPILTFLMQINWTTSMKSLTPSPEIPSIRMNHQLLHLQNHLTTQTTNTSMNSTKFSKFSTTVCTQTNPQFLPPHPPPPPIPPKITNSKDQYQPLQTAQILMPQSIQMPLPLLHIFDLTKATEIPMEMELMNTLKKTEFVTASIPTPMEQMKIVEKSKFMKPTMMP